MESFQYGLSLSEKRGVSILVSVIYVKPKDRSNYGAQVV